MCEGVIGKIEFQNLEDHNMPTGPTRSSSSNVHVYMYIYVPSSKIFLTSGLMCRNSVIKTQHKVVFRIGRFNTLLPYHAYGGGMSPVCGICLIESLFLYIPKSLYDLQKCF